MAAPKKPAADSFFDLSKNGKVPDILREIADRVERGEISADVLQWKLTQNHLEIALNLDLHGE
jgi:hypothetical protein